MAKDGHPLSFFVAVLALRRTVNVLSGSAVDAVAVAIEAVLDPVASSVEMRLDPIAFPVEMTLDPVPFAVESLRQSESVLPPSSGRRKVQSVVDSITPAIQMLVDPCAAKVQPAIDPASPGIPPVVQAITTGKETFTGIRHRGARQKQNAEADQNSFCH